MSPREALEARGFEALPTTGEDFRRDRTVYRYSAPVGKRKRRPAAFLVTVSAAMKRALDGPHVEQWAQAQLVRAQQMLRSGIMSGYNRRISVGRWRLNRKRGGRRRKWERRKRQR